MAKEKVKYDIGTLAERAILVTLHIGVWSASKFDKEISEEVNTDYDADLDAARVSKRLISREALQGITKVAGIARRTHRIMTMPWDYEGTGIMANRGHIAYETKMNELHGWFRTEVKDFVKNYPDHIAESKKARMGKLFKDEDYPSIKELPGKFTWDIEYGKVPEAGDFRVKMDGDTAKAIAKDIEARTNERVAAAMGTVFERVVNLSKGISETLRKYDPSKSKEKGTKGTILRDSLINNVVALAESLPYFNITDDPRIDQLAAELRAELAEFSSDELKTDVKKRQLVTKRADAIAKKVFAYI